jgi:O-acetyl-ADP-ribose deacetylase (regulator of RNase III)
MIIVVRGDLAEATTRAVLRPVTAEWAAPTPAMRRLEVSAGTDVAAQCERLGELPVGSAVVTQAGALQAELLIHVVVRSATEPVTTRGVGLALRNGLRRADEWGVDALALPPLGTGAGNLDAEDAAALMVPILAEARTEAPRLARIEIHVDSDYEQAAFEREVAASADGRRPAS